MLDLVAAAAAKATDSVPLWLYLVTAFGVAGVGVVGVMLSNRSHSQQIERQLNFERERIDGERDQEHARWVREKRVEAYQTFFRTTGVVVSEMRGFAVFGSSPKLSAVENFTAMGEDLRFWATDDVAEETARLTTEVQVFAKLVVDRVGASGSRARLRSSPSYQRG